MREHDPTHSNTRTHYHTQTHTQTHTHAWVWVWLDFKDLYPMPKFNFEIQPPTKKESKDQLGIV